MLSSQPQVDLIGLIGFCEVISVFRRLGWDGFRYVGSRQKQASVRDPWQTCAFWPMVTHKVNMQQSMPWVRSAPGPAGSMREKGVLRCSKVCRSPGRNTKIERHSIPDRIPGQSNSARAKRHRTNGHGNKSRIYRGFKKLGSGYRFYPYSLAEPQLGFASVGRRSNVRNPYSATCRSCLPRYISEMCW